jgi:hypothetical protein
MANAVPVLCVARNVACNVRGGFFRLVNVCYEIFVFLLYISYFFNTGPVFLFLAESLMRIY